MEVFFLPPRIKKARNTQIPCPIATTQRIPMPKKMIIGRSSFIPENSVQRKVVFPYENGHCPHFCASKQGTIPFDGTKMELSTSRRLDITGNITKSRKIGDFSNTVKMPLSRRECNTQRGGEGRGDRG
jgi:hypothetical protein